MEDMVASHVFMNVPHCFVTDCVHLFLFFSYHDSKLRSCENFVSVDFSQLVSMINIFCSREGGVCIHSS